VEPCPRSLSDSRPEDQGGGPGRREEAGPEESPHVGRRHAEGPAGLQAHGQHGPEGQPEAGQEGGQGGGESSMRNKEKRSRRREIVFSSQ